MYEHFEDDNRPFFYVKIWGNKMKKYFMAGLMMCFFSCAAMSGDIPSFKYNNVVVKARELALKKYKPQELKLPQELISMDYDAFRNVRYVREEGPWYGKNIPFEIQFFHMGSIFKNSVRVNEIIGGKSVYIPYEAHAFTNNDKPLNAKGFGDIDYAGFRLHYPLNTPDYYDELITFLGASYFRALGQGQKYGISARGLAIDTGLQTGEEFPIFKEFWVKRPAQRNRNMTIYALLDSKSVTGAYEFFIQPGKTTKVDVTATIFPREDIKKLGIAPLTSMYLFGENTKTRFFDYRPEVHDSDGFLVLNGNDEWLWRPLDNSKQLRMSSFVDHNPKGFGLLQRDRNPDHYQDMEAYYEQRPSVWIEPLFGFSKGSVHLVEIPSDREIHDNVVAFFWPDKKIEKGKEYLFKYRMHWMSDAVPEISDKAYVDSTYSGVGGVAGSPSETFTKFVIDFKGGKLDFIENESFLNPVVSASSGHINNIVVQKNTFSGGYRLFFDYKPDEKTAELRASLSSKNEEDAGAVLTEVWSYQFLP